MLFPFCFFGQMACGAVFGIVPFLSHRRSGLTVGVVAAGGNVGAAVLQVWHSAQAAAVSSFFSMARSVPAKALYVFVQLGPTFMTLTSMCGFVNVVSAGPVLWRCGPDAL